MSSDGDYSLVADFGRPVRLIDGTERAQQRSHLRHPEHRAWPGAGRHRANHVAPRSSVLRDVAERLVRGGEQPFYDGSSTRTSGATGRCAQFVNKCERGHRVGSRRSPRRKTYGADTPYMRKFLDLARDRRGEEEPNYIILRYADNCC